MKYKITVSKDEVIIKNIKTEYWQKVRLIV